jgi:hypothetical protein
LTLFDATYVCIKSHPLIRDLADKARILVLLPGTTHLPHGAGKRYQKVSSCHYNAADGDARLVALELDSDDDLVLVSDMS